MDLLTSLLGRHVNMYFGVINDSDNFSDYELI